MGSGQSVESTTPKPQLLNNTTTLTSDSYSLIFNIGAGAGIMLIILIVGLIIARILFPKMFTGLCNKAGRTRDHLEELYGRIKNRYRRVDPAPQPQAHPMAPPAFYQPPAFQYPMLAPPQPMPMHVPMPMAMPQAFHARQEQRFVELPAEQPAGVPPLPPRPMGNA